MQKARNLAGFSVRHHRLVEIVGIQRTAIYDRIKKGTFPAPISLGPRAVVWDSTAIVAWQEKIIAEARAPSAKN